MAIAEQRARMIDNFALGLTHGLMLLAAWRLLSRRDLEDDAAPLPDREAKPGRWGKATDADA